MSAQHEPADGLVRWREPTQIALTPILTAALEAFYETGYHGTSVRDIARRVGGSVATARFSSGFFSTAESSVIFSSFGIIFATRSASR